MATNKSLQHAANIDQDTLTWLEGLASSAEKAKSTDAHRKELKHLRWWYESSPETTTEEFYPRLDGVLPPVWRRMRRLIPRVNVLRPCVSTLVSAVYSGDVVRTLHKSPVPDLQKYVNSPAYNGAVIKWCTNALLFGTALAVPQVSKDGKISIYLPDPVVTWIETDPLDIYKITKIAEVTDQCIRYTTLTGYGIAFRTGKLGTSVHVPCNYGTEYLPVAYAAGEDCRCSGRILGVSAVRDALYWAQAIGDCIFKIRILQAKETTNLLVVIGDEETPLGNNPEIGQQGESTEGTGQPDKVKVSMGGDVKFIAPDPKITQSVEIVRVLIGQLATALGIPADALDANYSLASASAEAARIRAIPLLNRSKLLCQQWADYETDLIRAITAAFEYSKTLGAIKLADLEEPRVVTEIQYNPYVLPQSPMEVTTNLIARLGAGLVSPEEALREDRPNRAPELVKSMADDMRAQHSAAGGPAASVDTVFKQQATQRDATPPRI